MTNPTVPREIQDLIDRGFTFVCNHSAGKDSQAMMIFLHAHVPRDQLVVVHADLPGVEWAGVQDHITDTCFGLPLHTGRARRTLIEMIEQRGMFPSPKQRQCTSDLKRGVLEKLIRSFGVKKVVNCMGMRAQESSKRSKLDPFKFSSRNSKAGREWYDWLPIHDMTEDEVFASIALAGQKPHWAYAAGMSRLSCCFCIMASPADLKTAARLNPDLYRTYVMLERSTGQVMMMPTKKHGRRTLEDITGVFIDEPVSTVVVHKLNFIRNAAYSPRVNPPSPQFTIF